MSEKKIGEIAIIIQNRENAAKPVNEILSEYGDLIIARMGVPYREKDLHIISIVLEATEEQINTLTGKLALVKEVKVKSILV